MNKKDLALAHEAQQSVNLAIDPVRRLYVESENLLIPELVESMIKDLAEMDRKLKRIITCLEVTK